MSCLSLSFERPPISWEELCLPTIEGGIRLCDCQTWNIALHARTLWGLHFKQDSLWIKWVHDFYIREFIWNWHPKVVDSSILKHKARTRNSLQVFLEMFVTQLLGNC